MRGCFQARTNFSIKFLNVRGREHSLIREASRFRPDHLRGIELTIQAITIMSNHKKTSPSVGSQAARILSDPNSSNIAKALAASALSQRSPSHQTGASMEDLASRVLDSPKYSQETKKPRRLRS